jgi:hypothetical protein
VERLSAARLLARNALVVPATLQWPGPPVEASTALDLVHARAGILTIMADSVPTYAEARLAVLNVLSQYRKETERSFGRRYVLERAAQSLGQFGDQHGGLLVMAAYDDLFRSGVINFGRSIGQSGPEWGNLSEHGIAALSNVDRDPSNPTGYLAAIAPYLKGQDIALSYLNEALDTYNKGNVKASAVMLGCAVEALSLSLRDRLKARLEANGRTAPGTLDDWRIATVLRALEQQLDTRVTAMPRPLRERYESFWMAWTGLFRMTRNEAGHPKSIEPVSRDAVHGQLLLLHEHARLVFELGGWVENEF